MTGHTGPSGIVLLRNNLRKTGGAGRVVAVAEWTKASPLRDIWFVFIRRIYMQSCRAMAYFASHSLVARLLFKLVRVRVAINAGFKAGISQLLRTNLVDYLGAIMTQIAKSIWNEQLAGQH